MFLTILYILFSIQNLYCLNCYSNQTFEFLPNNFNWKNFSKILNNHEQLNSLSCHVRITIDYQNSISIQFHPIQTLTNTTIEFSTKISFEQNQIQTIKSSLDYTCSAGNLCDKIFLENWSRQLFNRSENSLYNHFFSLWNENSNICQIDRKTNSCESYLCFTIYNELKSLHDNQFQCKDQLTTNPIHIYIKTKKGNIRNEYQCQKNHCTGEVIYNLILENNSTELIQSKENQLKEINYKRILLILAILGIIGSIAFYIQCRKYKQGYKLTINA